MESQSKNNGWNTFLLHWGFTGLVALIATFVVILEFFSNLNSTTWICFFIAAASLMISGATLITFGVRLMPKNLARAHRWGWRLFLFGVVLSVCLLITRL
jgi:hypothetical protein